MFRIATISLCFALVLSGCNRAQGQDAAPRPTRQVAAPAPREGGNVDLPRFPSISPDGERVVFSWRGDLWLVPAAGGLATRITRHPGDDLRSAWSPDGRRIAFDSDRNGFANLYIMNADGTDVRQVSDTDRSCSLVGWGVDEAGEEVLTFSASIEGDIYRSPRPYMISTEGGEIRRVHDAFGDFPSVGPNGSRVLFTRAGSSWTRRHYRGPDARNVWMLHRGDDTFTQLTEWVGNDGMARWAGTDAMVYASDRELDTVNLYLRQFDRGEDSARRLTSFEDMDVNDFDVSADGTTVVLSAWDRLYVLKLDPTAVEPRALTITANEDEADNYEIKSINRTVSEAALSPDGKVMAMVAYGEVYVRHVDDKSPTQRVTRSHARDHDVAWSPDGLKLYFVSDRDGTDSIFAATVALTRSEVKEEFEKATNPPKEDEPEKDEEKGDDEEEPDDGNGAEDDDGDGGGKEDDAKDDDEAKDDKKDKKKKKKDLPKELQADRWHDAIRFDIKPVVATEHNDRNPSPSPDGKSLAFRRGRGDLMILDIESGDSRALATGWDMGLDWRWSPDSRHVAYEQNDMNFNADIWIVPADGTAPAVNVTRHPDNEGSPRWSADGKILAFLSERVNEEYDVWMVYLDADLEAYTPKELETYYKDAVKAAKKRKPLEVEAPEDDEKNGDDDEDADKDEDEDEDDEKKDEPDPLDLDDAYLRLQRVTRLNGSEFNLELTPGGDRYIFTGQTDESGLFSIKWDRSDQKRLTGSASVQHVSLTGDKVVIVTGNRAATVPPDGTKVEHLDISDDIRIDLQAQNSQKFLEAARGLGEGFYHPTMKGLDWDGLAERYHTLARQARTADEFNHVANRFIGELNASHLRITERGDRSPNAQSQGRLGTIHRRVAGGYEVLDVLPESPAATGLMALQVGDVITAIDTEPFAATDTLESRLTDRGGEETLITIRRTFDSGEEKSLDVLLTPISYGAERQLKYKKWRRDNAAKVAEWSDGGIGYIHIQGMNQPSLDIFERDLYAAANDKKGLIIDVRNNGGGWTADRLLASIMVRKHAYTIPRGGDPNHTDGYPQDRLFIQRYTLPANMLCNEKSFSNAEITSHAFKSLGRGTLVGQETYGGVISTGGWSLIDGTWVRLPFRGWYVVGGMDMENNGAVPDIIVPQTPEAESANDDQQLRAAVDDLMKRLR